MLGSKLTQFSTVLVESPLNIFQNLVKFFLKSSHLIPFNAKPPSMSLSKTFSTVLLRSKMLTFVTSLQRVIHCLLKLFGHVCESVKPCFKSVVFSKFSANDTKNAILAKHLIQS